MQSVFALRSGPLICPAISRCMCTFVDDLMLELFYQMVKSWDEHRSRQREDHTHQFFLDWVLGQYEMSTCKPVLKYYSARRLEQLSTSCALAAFIHEYCTCDRVYKRKLLDHLIDAATEYFKWQRDVIQLFIQLLHLYQPQKMIKAHVYASFYVPMREFLRRKATSAADDRLLQSVFDKQIFNCESQDDWGEPNCTDRWSRRYLNWQQYRGNVPVYEKKIDCITERRRFWSMSAAGWISSKMVQESKDKELSGDTWQLTPIGPFVPAVDLCITLTRDNAISLGKTYLADLLCDREMAFSYDTTRRGQPLFKMDGAISWFLFKWHAMGFRRVLRERAARLYTLLKLVLPCKLAVDRIVSTAMLMEYQQERYIAALLYDIAPPVFRELLVDEQLPIYVPLMTPMNEYKSPWKHEFERTVTIQPSVRAEIDGAQLSVQTDASPTTVAFSDNDHCGEPVLHYIPFSLAYALKDRVWLNDGSLKLSFRNKSESIPVSCLLLFVRHQVTFETIKLISQGTGVIECTGDKSFIAADHRGKWYSVSLKQYVGSRGAIDETVARHNTDPLLDWSLVSRLEITVKTDSADVSSNMRLYLRCFDYLVTTTNVCFKVVT